MRRRAFVAATAALPLAARAGDDRAANAPSVRTQSGEVGGSRSNDYFGMHFHRLVASAGNRLPTRWPAATVGSIRLWDSTTRWGDVAPRRDRWDFDRLDAHLEIAEQHGASVLYTLGSTPRWASARPDEPGPYGPGCAAEPASMADWASYVQRVVERYRGRIGTYEIWNEPYFSELPSDRQQPTFFSGSAEQMIAMTRIAREVVDRSDPTARLATPGFVNGSHRLDLFLGRGGARLVDVVAYHFYAADSAQFTSQVSEVRAVMARHGVGRLPLWNSECGVESSAPSPASHAAAGTDGASLAADRLGQFLLLGAATRLERWYYHAWDNDLTGMVDRDGKANPRAPAYEQMQRWLRGTSLGAVGRLPGGGFVFDAARGEERLLFAWSDRGEPFTPAVPRGWRIDTLTRLREGRRAERAPIALTSTPIAIAMRPARS